MDNNSLFRQRFTIVSAMSRLLEVRAGVLLGFDHHLPVARLEGIPDHSTAKRQSSGAAIQRQVALSSLCSCKTHLVGEGRAAMVVQSDVANRSLFNFSSSMVA
jgi:hypothetical protein